MQKLSVMIFLLISFCAQAEVRTKDGRQYMNDLKNRLEVEDKDDVHRSFLALRPNLPKSNSPDSMAASLDAIATLATTVCTASGYFNDEWEDLDGLYKSLMGRQPTDKERQQALRKTDGSLDYFANCFLVAMHPEFLLQKRSGK